MGIKQAFSAEPTMILAVVSAGLALGMGFGLDISSQQMGLIMAFAAAVLGLITRSQVKPVDVAKAELLTALTMPIGKTENDVKARIEARPASVPALNTPPDTVPGVPK